MKNLFILEGNRPIWADNCYYWGRICLFKEIFWGKSANIGGNLLICLENLPTWGEEGANIWGEEFLRRT